MELVVVMDLLYVCLIIVVPPALVVAEREDLEKKKVNRKRIYTERGCLKRKLMVRVLQPWSL